MRVSHLVFRSSRRTSRDALTRISPARRSFASLDGDRPNVRCLHGAQQRGPSGSDIGGCPGLTRTLCRWAGKLHREGVKVFATLGRLVYRMRFTVIAAMVGAMLALGAYGLGV